MKNEDLSDRLIDFSVRILRLTKSLEKTYADQHISKQLIRSGTSIGANYEEARGAESEADFKHKLSISLKEIRETLYWMKIIRHLKLYKSEKIDPIIQEAEEICSILVSSIKTIKTKE